MNPPGEQLDLLSSHREEKAGHVAINGIVPVVVVLLENARSGTK